MHALCLDACLFGLWKSPRGRFVVLVSICFLGVRGPSRVAGAEVLGLKPVTAGECLPDLRDYTFMWWAHGWRGAKVRCYQTGRYGLAMDTAAMRLLRFGTFDQTPGYAAAASLPNDVVLGLPDAFLEITVQVGAKTYRCASGAYPRLIESGRFVQRSDVEGLAFKDDQGGALAAEGRFELVAWPDRLAAHVDIKPHAALSQARASLRFRAGAATVTRESPPGDWPTGQIQTIDAVLFGPPREAEPGEVAVTAWDLTTKAAVPVRYDRVGGWFRVDVPSLLPERTDIPQMDRLRVRAANPSASPRAVRLCFAKEDAVPGITGLVPMLRDAEGFPVGIPVQISKNWHRQAERRLRYEGPWLHAFSMLRLPARSQVELEFSLAYGFWGKVPLASHAQLCLVGWGVDQLWDQAAIGSWGESICYDPDVNLQRSLIDDVRPLMVRAMRSKNGKWNWTNNVGGGDFLVYHDEQGTKQFLSRMRTAYLSQGPNLTDVVYSGTSADGRIAATLRVSTPRSDDVNRAYHRFRYDVLRPTKFSRLTFYQLGADNYNDHQFRKLARGNEQGLIEEWPAPQGGLRYHRVGIPCPGEVPWFSLHEAKSGDPEGGAWANRGLVIRSWKARLGGQDVPPTAASYGTDNGVPSANVELTPPPEVRELLPGDYVEGFVELVVLPQFADDYYGPNENLRQSLKKQANTWQPVLRQAVGNNLRIAVDGGRLVQRYPPVVALVNARSVEVRITGGLGYVPLSFAGLDNWRGWELCRQQNGVWTRVDQSVFGNDFWQVDREEQSARYRITFNVPLDRPGDAPGETRFQLRCVPQQSCPSQDPKILDRGGAKAD
jgi:hypothetical protein